MKGRFWTVILVLVIPYIAIVALFPWYNPRRTVYLRRAVRVRVDLFVVLFMFIVHVYRLENRSGIHTRPGI